MILLTRRGLAAAGATLASALLARKPRAAGTLADLGRLRTGPAAPLPAFSITLADGTERTIADYAGRGVVLNLWATWCVPCVAEMPALDALAGALDPRRFAVLPLSSDRGGAEAVAAFYAKQGIERLPVVLDPTGAATRALGARGIPTTLLIDAEGVERGRLEGAAAWASPEAIAKVRGLIGP